jgi:dTDP-4-dehydrorhamnose reductase
VERLLVVGLDTVVGVNLAAQLADKYHVVGLSASDEIAVEGCETATLSAADAQGVRQAIALYRPDQIVLCQAAADSTWNTGVLGDLASSSPGLTVWIDAARAAGKRLTLISSDAVFTGPWMFHTESCDSYCLASEADAIRSLEAVALKDSTHSLVIRSHCYGWSANGQGWIDEILAALESEQRPTFDCIAHATPILATDLADVLDRAWNSGLTGLYHVAGAERINPYRFACALAKVFDLAPPKVDTVAPCESPSAGFACGETSLHTRLIRRELGISMPMLVEGLERLRAQRDHGFDRRFGRGNQFATSKVA